jgi:hypothetical protein
MNLFALMCFCYSPPDFIQKVMRQADVAPLAAGKGLNKMDKR